MCSTLETSLREDYCPRILTSRRHVNSYCLFGTEQCLHLQSQAVHSWTAWPWIWRYYGLSKRRETLNQCTASHPRTHEYLAIPLWQIETAPSLLCVNAYELNIKYYCLWPTEIHIKSQHEIWDKLWSSNIFKLHGVTNHKTVVFTFVAMRNYISYNKSRFLFTLERKFWDWYLGVIVRYTFPPSPTRISTLTKA